MQQSALQVLHLVGIHRHQSKTGMQLPAFVAVTLRFYIHFPKQRGGPAAVWLQTVDNIGHVS